MTWQERAAAWRARFPWTHGDQPPADWPVIVEEKGAPVMYARWLGGQDYRNRSAYYGAYPHRYLERVLAFFPDVDPGDVLHVFSGSLPAGPYSRCDLVQPAEYQCSVYDLPRVAGRRWPLILADPPYSAADAAKYGTPALDRGRTLRALADVAEPGGALVWLDVCWPMHRRAQWRTAGRIAITRSTNHRLRDATIFERVAE